MFRQRLPGLTEGKTVEVCPFCREQPGFVNWPGRRLVVFQHRCAVISYEATGFPNDVADILAEWNSHMARARDFYIPTPVTLETT